MAQRPLRAGSLRRPPEGPRRGIAWALGVYLLAGAIGTVVLGMVAPDAHTALALDLAFLLVATVAVIAFWRSSEKAYARQERYRRALFDAEMGALARLREAGQIREDLIASVSHEFRTPLTAIRGAATTLQARGDRLRREDRGVLLAGIVEHSDRLSRLLEDMLLAASASAATDSGTIADVSAALSRFTLGVTRPSVEIDVPPELAAYVDRVTLDQTVHALADHVRAEARRDRPVVLRARRQAGEVVIDASYASSRNEEDLRRLFEPFGSRESVRSGRPASLALYVVRRLVEAQGGRTSAGRDDERVRVRVALRALRPRADEPAAESAVGAAAGAAPEGEPAGVGR